MKKILIICLSLLWLFAHSTFACPGRSAGYCPSQQTAKDCRNTYQANSCKGAGCCGTEPNISCAHECVWNPIDNSCSGIGSLC